jgi:hypothetical protein
LDLAESGVGILHGRLGEDIPLSGVAGLICSRLRFGALRHDVAVTLIQAGAYGFG